MCCLDASVWVYFQDAELPEHDPVRGPVADLLRSAPLFTTTVLQMEVVHYLHTRLEDGEEPVEIFLTMADVAVAELTRADVARAADLLADHGDTGIGGRDATVLAAMERHDVTRLWTHDAALGRMADRLDWLDVNDPVTS